MDKHFRSFTVNVIIPTSDRCYPIMLTYKHNVFLLYPMLIGLNVDRA